MGALATIPDLKCDRPNVRCAKRRSAGVRVLCYAGGQKAVNPVVTNKKTEQMRGTHAGIGH